MRLVTCLLFLLFSAHVHAHAGSTAYLQLAVDNAQITGRWDIALRDLDYALGLDTNDDGAVTWGELRTREAAVSTYALSRLILESDDGHPCALRSPSLQVADHQDGAYAVLMIAGSCPVAPVALTLGYQLFFDLDPTHRALLNLEWAGTRSAVLSPGNTRQVFSAEDTGANTVFVQYLREGLWHVWTGWDHLLFLIGLLLPAVLRREKGKWVAAPDLRATLTDTARIITAFTFAHACTLTIAALGWLSLPTAWVESAVAATVIFAGLNNLNPMVHRRLWLLAIGFGLIHGSAIAGALLDLGLPTVHRVWALLAFNLGVEAAQLLLAAVFVPVAFIFRRSRFYPSWVLIPGSVAIAAVGGWWLANRCCN